MIFLFNNLNLQARAAGRAKLVALKCFKANNYVLYKEPAFGVFFFSTEQNKIIEHINNHLDADILSKDLLIKMARDNDLLLKISYDVDNNEITRTFENLLDNNELNCIIIDVDFRKNLKHFYEVNGDKSIESLSKEDRNYLDSIYRLYDQKTTHRPVKSDLLGVIKRNYSTSTIYLVNDRISEIIKSIRNSDNFKTALTHKSYLIDNPSLQSYENLASYGENLLDKYVTNILKEIYPKLTIKELNEMKALLIDDKSLWEISKNIMLEKYIKTKTTKTFYVKSAVFKSFIAALYLERGSVMLFEFLKLTVFDKPEFTDKLDKLNIAKIPLIPMTYSSESLNDSLQIKESGSNLQDKSTENILNHLLILDKKIEEQSHYIDNTFSKEINKVNLSVNELKNTNALFLDLVNTLKKPSENQEFSNNIETSKKSTVFTGVTENSSNNELAELNIKNIAKGALLILNISIVVTLSISLIKYIGNSTIFMDESFIQVIKRLAKDILRINMENTKVENIPNVIDTEIINEDKDYLRSLYAVPETNDYLNDFKDEEKVNEIKPGNGILDYMLFGIILSAGYSLSIYLGQYITQSFNLNGTLSDSSDRIVIIERGIDTSFISNLLNKSKELIESGVNFISGFVHIHGVNFIPVIENIPGINFIIINTISLMTYLFDDLEVPLIPSEDSNDSYFEDNTFPFFHENSADDDSGNKDNESNYQVFTVVEEEVIEEEEIIEDFLINQETQTDFQNENSVDYSADELKKLEEENLNLKEVINEKESTINNQIDTLDQFNEAVEGLNQEVLNLKENLLHNNNEISGLKETISNHEKGIDKYKEIVELKDNIIDDQKHQVELMSNHIKSQSNSMEKVAELFEKYKNADVTAETIENITKTLDIINKK